MGLVYQGSVDFLAESNKSNLRRTISIAPVASDTEQLKTSPNGADASRYSARSS